ncbi:MAG TPA: hypothetical protein VIK96_03435 [Bacilli bacterium]
MNEQIELGKELLKILIGKGCEAYLIGEAVCYYILGLPIKEVEITTSATTDMLKGIFSEYKVEDEAEGYVRLYYRGYQFLIGTFKLGTNYRDDRKPLRMHYSKNLHDEVSSRDFTINSIAMSPAEKYTDIYRGYEDLRRKKIKTIGNPKTRFEEDPLRILIAFRFVSELGFRIEKRTYQAMRKKAKLLSKLEVKDMVKEMRRILNGDYFKKALVLLVDSGIYKRIPVLRYEFKRLRNNYRPESADIFLACAFVKAGGYQDDWGPVSENEEHLFEIVDLALANPRGNFSPKDLFFKGLDSCIEANRVNHLLKKSRKKDKHIRRAFDRLPIHTGSELAFSENDLRNLTKGRNTYNDQILETIVLKVLVGELQNDYQTIKDFVIASLKTYYGDSILSYIDTETSPESVPNNAVENPVKQIREENYTGISGNDNYQATSSYYSETEPNPDNKIESLEEKIRRLERQNLEMELNRLVDNLTAQNLDILAEMGYIKGAEKIVVTREMKKFYRDLIINIDPKLRPLKFSKERNDSNYEKED